MGWSIDVPIENHQNNKCARLHKKGEIILTEITACEGSEFDFRYTSKYGTGEAKMRKIR